MLTKLARQMACNFQLNSTNTTRLHRKTCKIKCESTRLPWGPNLLLLQSARLD